MQHSCDAVVLRRTTCNRIAQYSCDPIVRRITRKAVSQDICDAIVVGRLAWQRSCDAIFLNACFATQSCNTAGSDRCQSLCVLNCNVIVFRRIACNANAQHSCDFIVRQVASTAVIQNRGRQTDIQTDIQTDRQSCRHTYIQTVCDIAESCVRAACARTS